ncbi:MAG: hypothetical protein HQ556_09960 [Candidatus Marinimicrobia bacterium]|nr:hypothetical protein [Candidatus Neomarinimicrobiota bacterium]
MFILCPVSQGISQEKFLELPESISIRNDNKIFEPVTFPHRKHAHMSRMGDGCNTCHHYADDEIYDPCADCHTNDPKDLASGLPSLNAAFHRKCLSCHRGWNASNVCGTCHLQQSQSSEGVAEPSNSPQKTYSYPEVVNFQTPEQERTRVTFRHKQHVEMFRFKCESCHRDEDCKTCHGSQQIETTISSELSTHHFPCSQCHDTLKEPGCEKCHQNKTTPGFTHEMTTFPLKSFHSSRDCTNCHDPNTPVKKLDKTCTGCHHNFELGSFDHAATGLVLELGHEELDCFDCHLDDDFSKPPDCVECHEDEMKFPTDLPGTRLD